MKLIRLLVTVASNSRTISGLELMRYRRCNAELSEPGVKTRTVAADFDFGRYDSEGDAFVCEMLRILPGDLIKVEAI